MVKRWVPARGDVVWIDMDPQTGHEQKGRRPALVLSPSEYNAKVGLAVFCPVTSQAKGYPFEVPLPAGTKVSGVALSDQVKSLDWVERKARWICTLPKETVEEVLFKLNTLLAA